MRPLSEGPRSRTNPAKMAPAECTQPTTESRHENQPSATTQTTLLWAF
jgi:hypothetical protein